MDKTNETPKQFIDLARERAKQYTYWEKRANLGDARFPWDKERYWQTPPELLFPHDHIQELLGKSMQDLIYERRSVKGEVLALDIMGQAGFKAVDFQAAIMLTAPPDYERKKPKNLTIIEGDVLQPSTWNRLSDFIKLNDQTSLKGVDLATCRPVSGWYSVFHEAKFGANQNANLAVWFVLNRIVTSLSPGGILLTELPIPPLQAANNIDELNSQVVDYYQNWRSEFQKIEGLEVKFKSDLKPGELPTGITAAITKTGSTHRNLPKFPTLATPNFS